MTVKIGIVAWYSAAIIEAPWRIVALFSAAEPCDEALATIRTHITAFVQGRTNREARLIDQVQ